MLTVIARKAARETSSGNLTNESVKAAVINFHLSLEITYTYTHTQTQLCSKKKEERKKEKEKYAVDVFDAMRCDAIT